MLFILLFVQIVLSQTDNCETYVGKSCVKCKGNLYLTKVTDETTGLPKIICKAPEFSTTGDDACQKFDQNICYKCKDGYKLVNNKCEKCPNNCKICDDVVCYQCENNYQLSLDQQECVDCKESKNDEKCGRCSAGKYFNTATKKCESCKTGCSLCTSASDCLQCTSGYLENNACKEITNCKTIVNDHCEECNNGFRLEKGLCTKCSTGCLTCHKNDNEATEVCTECNNNLILVNGQCVEANSVDCVKGSTTYGCQQCKEGYFLNQNMKCEKCDSTCLTCYGTKTKCLVCANGYHFNNQQQCVKIQESCAYADQYGCKECKFNVATDKKGKYIKTNGKECESCDANCKTCMGRSDNCTSCEDDYILQQTEVASVKIMKCVQVKEATKTPHCVSSEMGLCIQCADGYYINSESTSMTDVCGRCPTSCQTCSDENNCLVCAEGYYRDIKKGASGLCVKSSIDIMEQCVVGVDGCIECYEGYYKNSTDVSSSCIKCPEDCKTCKYDFDKKVVKCTVCASEKFYVKDGECKKCSDMPHCIKASGSKCTMCENGYTLDPGATSCSTTNWAVIIPIDVVISLIIVALVVLFIIFALLKKKQYQKKLKEQEKLDSIIITMDMILENQNDEPFPLTLDTWDLTFQLNGSSAIVESSYEDRFTVTNPTKRGYVLDFITEESYKYELEIEPKSWVLKPGSSVNVSCKIKMLCTTEVDEYVGICVLNLDDNSRTLNKLSLKIKSEKSNSLDYKNLKPIMPAIGETRYGVVYRGTYNNEDVAIHKMRTKKFNVIQENIFNKEINILETMNHNNIIKLIGAVYTPGEISIVTELPEYYTLESLWGKQHILYKTKVKIMKEVANAMKFLHEKQYILRELTSAHVYVFTLNPEEEICAKLGDFKSIKNTNDEEELTKGIGSPIYMAPECLKDEGKYSYSSDVYSYAVLMYETFIEKLPYYSDSHFTQEWMIPQFVLEGKRLDKHPQMPENYWEVISSAWKQNPDERPEFQTILTLIEKFPEIEDDIVLEDIIYSQTAHEDVQHQQIQE